MARPRLPERTSINIYLTRTQKDYLIKKARVDKTTASGVIRNLLDHSQLVDREDG